MTHEQMKAIFHLNSNETRFLKSRVIVHNFTPAISSQPFSFVRIND